MDNIEKRIQELDNEMSDILDNAVYDCDIDEHGHKVKRCSQCGKNIGNTLDGRVICLKEIEIDPGHGV